MSEVGNLSVRLSLDNAQFERSVTSMNRTLKAMGQEIRGLQNKGKDWGSSIDGLRQKQDAYSRLLEGQKTKVQKLSGAYEEAKQKYGENSAEAEKLAVQLNKANAEMTRTERELSEITAELQRQERELAISQTNWYKFGEAAQQAGEKLKAVGDKMTSIGKELSMKLTAPLTALGTGIVKIGMDFDTQMSKVSAVSGATGADFDALREKSQALGATTKFTATQVAEGMEYLALAGYNTNQILASTDGLLNLAAAASMDLGNAADIVTDVMSAFGMEASKAGHAADVFAYAQANANTNVEQIGEAMKYAAPLANQMGWTIEQTAAAMMKLADNGLKGSIAGQAFASSVGRLSKPTTEMRKKMDELGISFFDANENMKSLPDIIAELEKGTSGLTMKQKSAALTTIFGAEAYKHWAILLESGSETLANYTTELENSDGTAERMADTMNDNLGGSLLMLKSALEGLAIQFSDVIKGDIRAFADYLTKLTGKFAALDDSTKKIILVVGAFVAAIGPLLVITGTMISSIGTIVSAFGAFSLAVANAGGLMGVLGAAFTALTGPIGLTIAAIVAIGAALVVAYNKIDWFRECVQATWDKIKEYTSRTFEKVKSLISTIVSGAVDFAKSILDKFRFFWDENGSAIVSIVKLYFGQVKSNIEMVMGIIKGIFQVVWPIISGIVKINFGFIQTTIKNSLDIALGVIQFFLKIFQGDWKGAFETIKTTCINIMNNIVSLFKGIDLKQIGKDIMKGFLDGIGSMASAIWNKVKEIADSVKNTIADALSFKTSSRSRTSMRMGGYANQLRSAMDNAYDGMNRLNTNYNSSRTYDYSRKMTNQITINASKNESRDLERLFRRLAFEF